MEGGGGAWGRGGGGLLSSRSLDAFYRQGM